MTFVAGVLPSVRRVLHAAASAKRNGKNELGEAGTIRMKADKANAPNEIAIARVLVKGPAVTVAKSRVPSASARPTTWTGGIDLLACRMAGVLPARVAGART